ncbi:MAG: nitroreductase family protein, partial [Dehalococcoidales bacterium]
MELVEAVNKRKTCRGFKTDPVSQDILREIITNSLRAPSWGNTQPWEFAIATGKALEGIKQSFADKAAEAPAPDFPFPGKFPDSYLARLPNRPRPPADRSDTDLRTERQLNSAQLYKTPCIIYIYTEREMYEQDNYNNVYAVFDCGLIAQNICLLAVPHGLSTVIA